MRLIQRTTLEAPLTMYYIGLDVHKRTISYCVKDAAGHVHSEGKIGSTRRELDAWIKTLPQPRMIAMEATIFTGWIYDHLLPHAEKVKVAHPLMLRAIAASKKKNDRIEAAKLAPRQSHELALIHARELERGNRNRATLAVARKVVCYMLAVERRQQDFVPAEEFSRTVAA
jgi:transposase